MTTSHSLPPATCPFHEIRTLPTDGTPLHPSPTLAQWRDEGAATPLRYADGHDGLIVTRHDLARDVLADPRFSQLPQRFPHRSGEAHADEIDDRAVEALAAAGLLGLDAPQHGRIRRAVTSRFSVRAARAKQEKVGEIVRAQLDALQKSGAPADLTEHFSIPIATLVHCDVLGVPEHLVEGFWDHFVSSSTTQQKFDYLREVIAARKADPGEDVVSDLLRSELSATEVEGALFVLMSSGRDSVAYIISTSMVALLTNPDQLDALREEPLLISTAIEEFMRVGAMFITLFPRTATEEIEIDGVAFHKGQTVSVSPVAANRDERHFAEPESFDIRRDAFGHLGFGHGPHGCVGQQLARIEIREAVTQLIEALPELRLVHAEQMTPMPFAHDVATYEAGSVIVAW
ncbi:cytochrome P450 [Microbacterium murale]|uniref:Cytochrome P450 n=1 Tax=Microbacterium murale TaxID=1081040 RepID=A0ABU0PF52_9MICO|nr:cytochrome P450 [Microbacterium murale]MDQ0645326.1 cytochrome P450 [Microbacterium murale]